MQQTRVIGSLTRYFGLLTLVFTAIMLISGISEDILATPDTWLERLTRLLEPLPGLWLALLPTVFMLSVLATFSRLNLSGDLRIWRTAGSSAWPFARSTALYGLILGLLMIGPLWPWSQPVDALSAASDEAVFVTDGDVEWTLAYTQSTDAGNRLTLFNGRDNVLRGLESDLSTNDGVIHLSSGWLVMQGEVRTFETLALSPHPVVPALTPRTDSLWPADLAYRLGYPIVLIGLGLLMLPLALSIDGQRHTLIKITGACLLALNALFVLLMTDALARAGIWHEGPFFSLRAIIILAVGLLALVLIEERTA